MQCSFKRRNEKEKELASQGDVGDHHTFLSDTGETLGIWEPRFVTVISLNTLRELKGDKSRSADWKC
jgi:hypothetical protein